MSSRRPKKRFMSNLALVDSDSESDGSQTDENLKHSSKLIQDDSHSLMDFDDRSRTIAESLKVVSEQANLNDTDSQISFDDSNSRFPLVTIQTQDVVDSLKVVSQFAQLDQLDQECDLDVGPNSESQSTMPLEGKSELNEDEEITFLLASPHYSCSNVLSFDDNARDVNVSSDFNAKRNEATSILHSEAESGCEKILFSVAESEKLNLSGFTDFASTPLRDTSDLSLSTVLNPQHSPVGSETVSSGTSDIELPSDLDSLSSENISIDMPGDLDRSLNSCSSIPNLDNYVDGVEEESNRFQKAMSSARGFKTEKLYDNSNQTVIEGISKIMDLYLENKESKSGFRRLVKTVSDLLPEINNLPSGSKILQFVEDLAPDVEADVHYFCKICLQYFSEKPKDCDVCGDNSEIGEFYTFDVTKIIKFLFESRDLGSIIDSMPQTDPSLLKDIQDGYVYKNANVNRGKYDVNLVLATDGVKVRKGSAKELWLLMFTPVEVPPHLKDSFTFIIGVWYDKVKPRGNTFLKPFCNNVQSVENTGVEWKHPRTQEANCSAIRITLLVADAPARAMCQNIMNHNGKNGCNLCEIRTVKTRPVPGKKRIRVYKYVEVPVLRTERSMENNAEEATRLGLPVNGVKGFSELGLLPSVDISQVVFPEFMHSVLLGVTRQVLKIWIEHPGQWSIANRLDEVDFLLSQIKHPSFVHRTNRSLQSRKLWKASDYYYFLLFESLIVLSGIVSEVYYQHFILLVKSIFTLLKRGISEYDLQEAESMLKLFVFQFSGLYSERDLTYNVHQLLHLTLSVRRFGPLSCNSAFPFEGINGTVAKGCHGTNFVGKEIVNNIKIYQGVVILHNICQGFGVEQSILNTEAKVLGSSKKIELSLLDRQFFENKNPHIFSRAQIGCETYTSEIHKVLSSANFHVMFKFNGKRQYGSIKYFAKCQDSELYLCIRLYEIENVRVVYHRESLKCVEHLLPFKTTDNLIYVNLVQIHSSLTKVGTVGNYLFVRPHLVRQVM